LHYDAAGRLTSVKKRLNDASATLDKTIAVNTYDELGQLKIKRLGIAGSSQLETLTYDYNIRGWLTGINKAYASTANSSANWFGQTLAYDSGFTALQYNGNIAGSTWKSKSDGIARAYGYSYDKVNRLVSAPFSQQNSGSSNWTVDQEDFSVSNLGYDANGNIMAMSQMGMVGTGKTMIDRLTYTYRASSNKLAAVADTANTASAKLGDFINGTNSGDDYDYDANGNLIKDLNKNITVITYNHLNLPDSIVITGKGRIKYLYDAAGVKWRKIVTDKTTSTDKVTVTDYIGGFAYQNDTLQFLAHEEGRIRPIFKTGQATQYPFDYFVKDHLGNVRMVLTDQTDFTMYAATMEAPAAATETALFSNIDNTRTDKPVGYPADESAGQNASVAKLTATGAGKKIGPSIVLRVMAGDTIQLSAKAFYKSNGPKDGKSAAATAENMVVDLVQAFSGNAGQANGAHGEAASDQLTPFNSNFYNNDYRRLKEKEPDQPNADQPKAYLNFVLFDDEFKLVEENSGVKQVKATPDELQTLGQDKMVIKKTGFLYAYTSNESVEPVFFDNIILGVNSGPLLEETHYYPFGLTMAGISSNALKGTNYPINRNKFNGIELNSDLDLYSYEAHYRNLDPQLGRWWQIDPKPNDAVSPYAGMDNSPIRYSDFLGDTTIAGAGFWRNAWEGLKDGGRATVSWVKSLGTAEGIGKTLDGMAAMSPFNVDEGSVGARAQMIDNTVNYVADIPNKTSDQIGHDVGYATEKIAETVVATKGASIVKNTVEGIQAAEASYVNLASPSRTAHIITGDATGGGHAWFGSSKSFLNGLTGKKSMFPMTWSNGKIMNGVSEVVTSNPWVQQTGRAGAMVTRSGQPVRFVTEGTYEGIKIRVINTHSEIITAFPIR
ncbi:RHS repeat-associated protein, partial [Chitinophaga polysaccharea]